MDRADKLAPFDNNDDDDDESCQLAKRRSRRSLLTDYDEDEDEIHSPVDSSFNVSLLGQRANDATTLPAGSD